MGRFDSLKENTSSTVSTSAGRSRDTPGSTYRSSNRNNNSGQYEKTTLPQKPKQPTASMDFLMGESFPELVKNTKTPELSVNKTDWLNAVNVPEAEQSKEEKYKINVNDPKYWKGAEWIGPTIMRGLKYDPRWPVQENHCLVHKIEYSRDGVNWSSSWEETFTEEQLDNMKYQEELSEVEEIKQLCYDNYIKTSLESNRYYKETGELDSIAQAELDRLEYEEYASQFDIYDDVPDELEEEFEPIDEEEYLEDDY